MNGTSCTTARDGAVTCTLAALSAEGGLCDSAHRCDPSAAGAETGYDSFDSLLHCDEPSKTCVVQASAVGAWCGSLGDCNGQKGFECLDATEHRPPEGAVGTCRMRKSAGAACDQFYQCASFTCTNGTCEPLLGRGEECLFDTQCASSDCTTGQCS